MEIGRANRPDMYNYYYTKPKPFIKRRYRFEVKERLNRDGEVITPINLDQVKEIIDICKSEQIEAIAVCFLHSYANPEHEQIVACHFILQKLS